MARCLVCVKSQVMEGIFAAAALILAAVSLYRAPVSVAGNTGSDITTSIVSKSSFFIIF